MKMRETLLVVAFSIAFQAVAAPPTSKAPSPAPKAPPAATQSQPQNSASAAASAAKGKNGFHWFTAPSSAQSGKIERVGNLSSRPWTEIVGWHAGQSKFPTAETAEPQLVLFRVKF